LIHYLARRNDQDETNASFSFVARKMAGERGKERRDVFSSFPWIEGTSRFKNEVRVISRIVDRDSFALDGRYTPFVMALEVGKPYAEDRANLSVSVQAQE